MKNDNFYELEEKAKEYGRIYGLCTNADFPGWNDEVDAFRHAFMQALFCINNGETFAKFVGDLYEDICGPIQKQSKSEKNMDLWNNKIGREIAIKLVKELDVNTISKESLDDIIADKIMQRMRKGELITHPSDKRKFTGFAANIEETEKSNCAGTYPVSGYVRKDGAEVSSYMRTCGAKHQGKTKIPPLHTLPKEEMEEWIKKLI